MVAPPLGGEVANLAEKAGSRSQPDLRGSIRGLLLRTWIRVLRPKATRLRKKPSMRRPMRWGSRPSGRRCGALSSFLLSGVGACSGQQTFPAEPEAVPLWLAPLFQHHPKCACRRTVTCLGKAQIEIVSDRRRLSALASFAGMQLSDQGVLQPALPLSAHCGP